jgi:voltage-gated potassium channel
MIFKKQVVARAFEHPSSPYFTVINDTLAAATVVSIIAIILETVPSLTHYHGLFLTIEWITVALFSLEYILRLWSSKRRRDYALSFFGIIDLVAILPTFIGITNLTFLKSARIIRIIRFLRLVRISKLSRVNVKDVEETIGIFGLNIALYAAALLLALLSFGVLLHLFDTTAGHYWSIPAGMYWAFAVFLGGLPAAIPPGTTGTLIFILAKFTGMALFGLLVGVVGKLFNQIILGKE